VPGPQTLKLNSRVISTLPVFFKIHAFGDYLAQFLLRSYISFRMQESRDLRIQLWMCTPSSTTYDFVQQNQQNIFFHLFTWSSILQNFVGVIPHQM